GLTSTGVTASTSVSWSVTSGTITDTTSTGDKHYGRFQAGSQTGTANVVVSGLAAGISDTALVTVMPAAVASVGVSPAAASVTVGQAVQLNATLKDASGIVLTGRTVSWASGAPGVATVSGTGLVTSVTAGSATITATSEGVSGRATITV